MSNSALSVSWNCEKCTYFHKCHGTRCAMCGALRVTKQQMRDFIAGKTLKKNSSEEHNFSQLSQASHRMTPTTMTTTGLQPTRISNPYVKTNTSNTVIDTNKKLPGSVIVLQSAPQQPKPNSTIGAHQPLHPKRPEPPTLCNTNSTSNLMNKIKVPSNPHLKGILQDRPQSVTSSRSHHGNTTTFFPGPVPIDPTTASNWKYPIHGEFPVREYQLEISQTAILHNTLVSLPTGLGKTLIAAVVLYNYYRWFPNGTVVFLAPTLPLVHQQIQACYQIMGIPASDTAVLTGRVSTDQRTFLWKQRRAFFCTPQTVEKDLCAGRCDATRIVCVVFDEAHKASGNYAYTKVVDILEAAGAKFRILGLSATPGGEIKAIQKVVDALRIGKIEARMEDDASVKKYIHERHNEIVVVQQGSAVTTVERLLNNVVAPVLEALRRSDGLPNIRGNATLTQYNLLKASQEYYARTGDNSLRYLFLTAQTLVGIRTDVRRIGIGVARQKLIYFRDDPRNRKFVTENKDFQAVMAHVLRSSSNPDDSQETSEDRKLNNPKLMKLDEILKEHFNRSDACGESSRAIVFSQWRDSVSEIVAVLTAGQPLLRPRHFIGQGKSAGKSDDKKALNGMNQKEQQQVMLDFQNGVFNILVCTSIGEEGLDIGEVDLIVNFDTLRSPIRMIQRVGRTGRKRDGRVVFLVSEGAEEKTMVASKQAERTLGRALRRSDAFTFIPSRPMFQVNPELMQVDMSITATLHMSQVGGHLANSSSKEKIEPVEKTVDAVDKEWRLTEDEETKRSAILGPISSILCESTNLRFPLSLRRQLLRGRERSFERYCTSQSQAKDKKLGKSDLTKILIAIELNYGKPTRKNVMLQGRRFRMSRIGATEKCILNNLFPLQRNEAIVASIQQAWTQQPLEENGITVEQQSTTSISVDMETMRLPIPEPPSDSVGARDACTWNEVETNTPIEQLTNPIRPSTTLLVSTQGCQPSSTLNASETYLSTPLRLPTPDASSASEDDGDDETDENCRRNKSNQIPTLGAVSTAATYCSVERETLMCSSPLNTRRPDEVGSLPRMTVQIRCDDEKKEERPSLAFRLPTQDSSSDETDKDYGNEENGDDASFCGQFEPGALVTGGNIFNKNEVVCNESPVEILKNIEFVKERDCADVPTFPGSTTIESNVCEDSRDTIVLPNSPMTRTRSSPQTIESMEPCDNEVLGSMMKGVDIETQESKTQLCVDRQANACNGDIILSLSTPLKTNSIKSKEILNPDLLDTPMSLQLSGPTKSLKSPCGNYLVDTPEVKTGVGLDIVCSVCATGDVTLADPIVLCDGPGNGETCEIAVHVSCYSIQGSLDTMDEWRCDRCDHQYRTTNKTKVDSIVVACSLCKKSDGALKLVSSSTDDGWFHPACQIWCASSSSLCGICRGPGAVLCTAESCMVSAHPHCGLTTKSKRWRIVVFQEEKLKLAFCNTHSHEVNQILDQNGIAAVSDNDRYLILPSSRYPKKSDSAKGDTRNKMPSKKRLRKMTRLTSNGTKTNETTTDSIESKSTKKARIIQQLRKRHESMLRSGFIDSEAAIDDDEDPNGDEDEEDEMRRMEAEELNSSFINDSSQLGYTQDELDCMDLDKDDDHVHRRLDADDAFRKQFVTPILNRRMMKSLGTAEVESPWGETQGSHPQGGLGNMHFIRSVLEHHRNGGNADDIEELFHEIGRDVTSEEVALVEKYDNLRQPHIGLSVSTVNEDAFASTIQISDVTCVGHIKSSPLSNCVGGLTAEQKAFIEQKRQAALKRRQSIQR